MFNDDPIFQKKCIIPTTCCVFGYSIIKPSNDKQCPIQRGILIDLNVYLSGNWFCVMVISIII